MTIRNYGEAIVHVAVALLMLALCMTMTAQAYQPPATTGSGEGFRNRGLGYEAKSWPSDGSTSATVDATGFTLDLTGSATEFAHDITVYNSGSEVIYASLHASTVAMMGTTVTVPGVSEYTAIHIDIHAIPAGLAWKPNAVGRYLSMYSTAGSYSITGWAR